MKKLLLGSLLGLSTTFGLATAAWGHAVQTDYFVDLFSEELELAFTATYSTGEPMEDATVLVYAPGDQETPWLESQTDAAGNFTFLPDESLQGDWRIEFEKEGHQDILSVPVDENGIDYTNISQIENTDIHYAEMAPEAIGVLSAVSLGALAVAIRRRLSEAA
ncbi:MAG: carboxypeptidase regulatory-like domain-containing protein [Leptolyngbya sp. SIO1E4]|nr:carboxypeptidase regulatory-like domain-containing protein [Leptolyngbya sp. SIO1E4]